MTRTFKLAPYLLLGAIICASTACSTEPTSVNTQAPKNAQSDTNVANNAQGPELMLANLSRPAVDASSLQITQLAVTLTRVGGLSVGSVGYAVSGQADYVEIQGCAVSDCTAPNKVFVNRHVLKAFPAGPVSVKARACVEPARAKVAGTLCGSWETTQFTQPRNESARLVELLTERKLKADEIEALGIKLKNALTKFEKDAADCVQNQRDAQRMQLMKNLVGNFLQLGEGLLTRAIGAAPADVAVPAVTEVAKPTQPSIFAPMNSAVVQTAPDFSNVSFGDKALLEGKEFTYSQASKVPALNTQGKNLVGETQTSEMPGATPQQVPNNAPQTNPGTNPQAALPPLGTPVNQLFPMTPNEQPTQPVAPIVDPLVRVRDRMQAFNSFDTDVRSISSSIGLFQEAKPMPAIQTLAGAVFDLFSARQQTPGLCMAETTARNETQAIAALRQALAARVLLLDVKIKEGSPK